MWWRNIPYFVSRGYYVITHDARFFGTSSSGDSAKKGFEGAIDRQPPQSATIILRLGCWQAA